MTLRKNATEERIVDAAVQLFSRQGFNGTSTREIARLADVNEVTVFRYFARKKDLFWAAVDSRVTRLRLGKELQAGLAQDGAPEVVVPLIVEFLVQIAIYQPELIRLLHFSLLEMRPGAERIYREQLGPIFQTVIGYLERCIRSGVLRKVDPSVTAVSFATTILAHHGLHPLLTGVSVPHANTEEAVSAYSSFWLNLLVPTPVAELDAALPAAACD